MSLTIPQTPSRTWAVDALFQGPDAQERAAISSRRLLSLVGELPEGSGATITWSGGSGTGARITIASSALATSDLEWVTEDSASWQAHAGSHEAPLGQLELWQVVPTLTSTRFPSEVREPSGPAADDSFTKVWSQGVLTNGIALLGALQADSGTYRIHVAAASRLEHEMMLESAAGTWQMRDPGPAAIWVEQSVRIRALLALPHGTRGIRSRAAVRALGVGLDLVPVADGDLERYWEGDPESLFGMVQPVGVAAALLRFPAAPLGVGQVGVRVIVPPARPVPLVDVEVIEEVQQGILLGSAVDAAGAHLPVRVPASTLTRHLQVIGASGTGKTSALAGLAVSAIENGYGVTVLSPHPDLAERVAAEIDPSCVDRLVLVRSGDPDAIVPINALTGADTMAMETFVSILQDIIDPARTGMFGMRAQRLISQGFAASRALFGDRASIITAAAVFHDQRFVTRIADAIEKADPATARSLRHEVGAITSHDYGELVGWLQSRLHTLIGTQHMRRTLGTGHDALDVVKLMDHRGVLLVDLASLSIGTASAQMLGELWLAKHWDALSQRKDRVPHLLVIDECHLFGSGLLPRLLAEGRKFGIGVVLAHQHLGQLSGQLRDAAQANASSVLAFRMAPQEAGAAAARLGAWSGEALTRTPNLHAAATLSLPGTQGQPFTLIIDHNDRAQSRPEQFQAVESRSHRLLVRPYADARPLDIANFEHAVGSATTARSGSGRSVIDDVLAARAAQRRSGTLTSAGRSNPSSDE